MDAVVEPVGTHEFARESLMAISQSLPEKVATPSSLGVPPADENVTKVNDAGGAEKYRSKLISISYPESPDAEPLPAV